MEDLLRALPGPGQAAGRRQTPSLASLRSLHALLSAHGSPALRHAAFQALMRAGGQAPTLFRPEEEDDGAAAAGAAGAAAPLLVPSA